MKRKITSSINHTSILPEWAVVSVIGHGLLEFDGIWLGANPALCHFLRVSGELLAGSPLENWLHEDSRAVCAKALDELFKGKTSSVHVELKFLRTDETPVFAEVFFTRANPLDVESVLLVQIIDITERLRAKEELRLSNARMRLATTAASMGIWERDVREKESLWDEGMLKIYGITRMPSNVRWENLVHPEDLAAAMESKARAVAEGRDTCLQEFRIVRPDGGIRHIRSLSAITRDEHGEVFRFTGIDYDITQQKTTEEQLRRNEARLRRILDNMPLPVAIFPADHPVEEQGYVLINRKYTDFFGYTAEEIPNIMEWAKRAYPDEAYRASLFGWWEKATRRAREADGVLDATECRVTTKSGSVRDIFLTSAIIDDIVVVAMQDITKRKLSEQTLQKTNARMRLAAEAADVGFWEFDAVTGVEEHDEQIRKIYGVPPGEVKKLWREYVHPDDLPTQMEEVKEAFAGRKERCDLEFRIIRPDGEVRTVKSLSIVTRDAKGHTLKLTGIDKDITERKRAAAELESARLTLEKVAYELTENMPAGTFAMKSGLGITPCFTFLSRRMLEICGIDREAVLADKEMAFRAVHPEDRPGIIAQTAEVFATLEPFRWEGRIIVDGALKWVTVESNPRESSDGAMIWEGVLTDITARKSAEQALAEALKSEQRLRDMAERATKAKSRFLASISHEIRTPLSTLVALSRSMLKESEKHELSATFGEHLQSVRAGGQYLNLILTNLLDISAIESGYTPLRPEFFYLGDWVEDVSSILAPLAATHGVRLEWKLPEDDNVRFTTDPVRLTQILLNLAHNAVKFSDRPEGVVTISIGESPSGLELVVADEGPGIEPSRLESLFEEYSQSEVGSPAFDRGIGLGLAIVRENTRLLGGVMQVEPVEPRGLRFKITLPALTNVPADADPTPCAH